MRLGGVNKLQQFNVLDRPWKAVQKTGSGGAGIVLGKLPDGRYLVGIDLNSCRDVNGVIAGWAEEVLERFDTYAEISPSGTGVKVFFLMTAADMGKLRDLLGTNDKDQPLTRKSFAAGKHREVAIDTARFYAVTDQRLENSPEHFRLVSFADVEWFIAEAGPRYLASRKAATATPNPSMTPSRPTVTSRLAAT